MNFYLIQKKKKKTVYKFVNEYGWFSEKMNNYVFMTLSLIISGKNDMQLFIFEHEYLSLFSIF